MNKKYHILDRRDVTARNKTQKPINSIDLINHLKGKPPGEGEISDNSYEEAINGIEK
tara:strand:+ start:1073 stop:1243 length:171 start_codon:yes stop_codon:yes gene_type:complete